MRGAARPVLAALLAAAAAVTAVIGLRGPAIPERAIASVSTPDVPLWSARRVPLELAEATSGVRLPGAVEAAVEGTQACFVLREGDQTVVDRASETPLIPASTQKLLVAAAALAALGPDHRFDTSVVVQGGASPSVGTLWLVGGGDPVLMVHEYAAHLQTQPVSVGHPTTQLEALADSVAGAGVRSVGTVAGDASRHSGAPTVPTWKPSYISDRNVPHLSALTVNGGWSAWTPATVTAPDPAREAAAQLTRLLRERGVEVLGEPSLGRAPEGGSALGRVRSPTVSELATAMLRESDNLIAETLLREIGLARGGAGDTPQGAAAALEALAELGVDVTGVTLVDGSGLDRGNRATCAAVMGALSLHDRPGFDVLDEGLAVAGRTGTLSRRMRGGPLEGRLRAKTGTLNGVTGLVGVFDRSPPLSFALLANDSFGFMEGARIQERVGEVLLRYPYTFEEPERLAPPGSAAPATAPETSGAGDG